MTKYIIICLVGCFLCLGAYFYSKNSKTVSQKINQIIQKANTPENRAENVYTIETNQKMNIPIKKDFLCKETSDCPVDSANSICIDGYCVASGPGCLYDSDCYNENQCVEHTCINNTCQILIKKEVACETLEGYKGTCNAGVCLVDNIEQQSTEMCTAFYNTLEQEKIAQEKKKNNSKKSQNTIEEIIEEDTSTAINQCILTENDCMHFNMQTGHVENVANGTECENELGIYGTCQNGYCKYEKSVHEKEKNCYKRYDYWGRAITVCKENVKAELSFEKLNENRNDLTRKIVKALKYDVHVGLIKSYDGGYNIIITNTRKRNVVRGMVDPSLVAWDIALFTRKTNWKSNHAQIWTLPRKEGWHIPTDGSRKALRKGQAAAGILGIFGVVELETYREWLEKKFRYIEKGY